MEETKRYAVVTGANKGIGFEICRQLASNGITVVLTARDEKRGLAAVQKLRESGLDNVVFHQLDVADPASIQSLADFITRQFGKLDILVNNAGIAGATLHDVNVADPNSRASLAEFIKSQFGSQFGKLDTSVNDAGIGVIVDTDALGRSGSGGGARVSFSNVTQTYQLAEECLITNYYGAKRMAEALIPLLQFSHSPRIVNVSSFMSMLKNIPNAWAKEVLNDAENLTEERVDEVLTVFLNDFTEGSLETKGWPQFMSANTLSKAAMNAYTRILAKKYPNFCINCVCPGYVKTDINYNRGILSVEEGAASPVWLALLPDGRRSGCFFIRKELSSF